MLKNMTPGKADVFTRYCVALSCCWPLPPRATRFQVVRFQIFRLLMYLNPCILLPALAYSLFVNFNDYATFSKAAWHFIVVTQTPVNMSICIVQYDLLQKLVAEMIECYKRATSYEKYVYQQYVDRYFAFYGVSALWFYMTTVVVAAGTVFLHQPFPTSAEYPFPVDYQPLRGIIFLHQMVAIFQCSSHVCMSVFCALLMFFAAARFEILKMELRQATTSSHLIRCMKQYHIIRRFAKNVTIAVRPLALVAVVICCIGLVFWAISFIEPQPFSVRVQTIPVVGTGFIEIYMYAWPADHLLDLSQNVMEGIYESRWYEQSMSKQKNVLIMLIPQSSVGIKVLYIIPTLSLNYYCSFVSNVMSIFTVLRAALQDE